MRAVGRGDTINPTDGFDKSPRSAGVDGDPHNVRGCHRADGRGGTCVFMNELFESSRQGLG